MFKAFGNFVTMTHAVTFSCFLCLGSSIEVLTKCGMSPIIVQIGNVIMNELILRQRPRNYLGSTHNPSSIGKFDP